ncbi:hypothetical protein TWF730_000102 [Orbilia blumenaviensis]|uniref:Ubiquitin-like domain-containing protein n=1 Tax=Orbilia blumenaviensis TaxID=1796055 RepID=A0AAV9VML2_9PEZI
MQEVCNDDLKDMRVKLDPDANELKDESMLVRRNMVGGVVQTRLYIHLVHDRDYKMKGRTDQDLRRTTGILDKVLELPAARRRTWIFRNETCGDHDSNMKAYCV